MTEKNKGGRPCIGEKPKKLVAYRFDESTIEFLQSLPHGARSQFVESRVRRTAAFREFAKKRGGQANGG